MTDQLPSVGERTAMEKAGFTWDPCGYARWTRFQAPMITCLQAPWMRDNDWFEHCLKKIQFLLPL